MCFRARLKFREGEEGSDLHFAKQLQMWDLPTQNLCFSHPFEFTNTDRIQRTLSTDALRVLFPMFLSFFGLTLPFFDDGIRQWIFPTAMRKKTWHLWITQMSLQDSWAFGFGTRFLDTWLVWCVDAYFCVSVLAYMIFVYILHVDIIYAK